MKLLRSSLLVAAVVAVSAFSVCADGQHVALPLNSEAGSPTDEFLTPNFHLRRDLAGSGTDTPAPTTPTPTTTAPPSTTSPPATTTPEPTTTQPATTTPSPTTTTPATTTPSPTTTTPATTAPVSTTATPTPTSTDATKTPSPTTTSPATTKPTASGSSGTEPTETPVSSRDGSASRSGAPKPAAGSTDTNSSTSKDSNMSTGTIIGIVCGIVGGVVILAIIAVVLARKRRDDDDDPLSPFELSMDKGYTGVAVMQSNNQSQHGGSQYTNNNNNGYTSARTTTNNSALISGAAVGGGAALVTTDTPQAGSDAAGVAYTQFYDVVTSPGSMYPQSRLSSHTDDNATIHNDSNLWMSAMEPKDSDMEGGTSVPPAVSLPGDDYDDNHSSFISRNSYDHVAGSESIDIDQSSVLSGGSDLDKDFPDYEDESSRGSYEL